MKNRTKQRKVIEEEFRKYKEYNDIVVKTQKSITQSHDTRQSAEKLLKGKTEDESTAQVPHFVKNNDCIRSQKIKDRLKIKLAKKLIDEEYKPLKGRSW